MLNNHKILAIIPARGGSKGVPGKNLRVVNGKSLLAHTIEHAKTSQFLDRIIVSSEDEIILQAARKADAATPFIRPAHLARDDTPTSDVILHALEILHGFDYFVLLQVTSPLRTSQDIDHCLSSLLQLSAPACVSVCEAQDNPAWMFTITEEQILMPILGEPIPTQRQACRKVYILNGAVYAAKTDWYRKHKNFISPETISYVMPRERSLDIDTELDFEVLNQHLHSVENIC